MFNGGGLWLGMDKYVLVVDWLCFVDVYCVVLLVMDVKIFILVIWGIDVVYGYNNVYGVMLFLYNIGFGVVGDVELIECIGEVIVCVICVMGIDWVFVLILVVVYDLCWGCIYESFLFDLVCVCEYVWVYVRGV